MYEMDLRQLVVYFPFGDATILNIVLRILITFIILTFFVELVFVIAVF